jgi:hypothetical protein
MFKNARGLSNRIKPARPIDQTAAVWGHGVSSAGGLRRPSGYLVNRLDNRWVAKADCPHGQD